MAAADFFADAARTRAPEAIAQVERETCAEVVITVRRVSADYRSADYLFGFATAIAVLIALLFLPQSFDIAWFPIDLVVAFALGAIVSNNFAPLRRALAGAKRQRAEVDRSARAAFYEQGISKTRDRCGVLVYASIFERHASLVVDIGVDLAAIGPEWGAAVERIEAAVAAADLDRFLEAVKSLGPILGRAHPRAEDDVNELPDEMHVA